MTTTARTASHKTLARLPFGDLLVQPASAHGRHRGRQHVPFDVGAGRRFGGMHHFDLLNHPDVWTAMRGLLGQP